VSNQCFGDCWKTTYQRHRGSIISVWMFSPTPLGVILQPFPSTAFNFYNSDVNTRVHG